MTARLDYAHQSPQQLKKFTEFSMSLAGSPIGQTIHTLVEIRASQINGCAFCVDMHAKQAKLHGERELRLYHLPIWRESTLFSPRERAALAWTEVLTKLPEGGVPDDVYESVRREFSEKEISDLTFCIVTINGWNRLSIAFKSVPGSADKAFGLDKAGLS